MKKRLVTALLLSLACSSPGAVLAATADNPLSDVPAQHWAYESLQQLIKAGVIEGYQGKYNGGRTLTRYEMSRIVAKAMGKMESGKYQGNREAAAAVEKLAKEFSAELHNNFLIRLDQLEKKTDNLKMDDSYLRTKWNVHNVKKDGKTVVSDHSSSYYRTNLGFKGDINKKWDWIVWMRQDIDWYESGQNANTNSLLNRAYITGPVGDIRVSLGRQYHLALDGTLWESYFDGVKLEFGNKIKNTVYYGYHKLDSQVVFYDNTNTATRTALGSYIMAKSKAANSTAYAGASRSRFYGFESECDITPQTNLTGAYYVLTGVDLKDTIQFGSAAPITISTKTAKAWEGMLTQKLGGNFEFQGTFTKTDARMDNKAYTMQLLYKTLKKDIPGSYNIQVQHRMVDRFAQWNGVYDCSIIEYSTDKQYTYNSRIWDIEVDYVPWKNIVLKTTLSLAKSTDGSNLKDRVLSSYANYYF